MPIFQLPDEIIFPPPNLAEPNGLLAVGGDLSVSRLIAAYRNGIFPWFSEDDPILWWFTSPRLVLSPEDLRISKRLRRYWKNSTMTLTINAAFGEVIEKCSLIPRKENEGTWITRDMITAYKELHRHHYAHSVECWQGSELVGGLYGIALGKVFFGESMFTNLSNGSKIALVYLVNYLKNKGFGLIDCQMTTDHLLQFGAREISGRNFLRHLKELIIRLSPDGVWTYDTKN